MLVYTIGWEKIPARRSKENFITVRVTCLNEAGKILHFVKTYEEWMGVCTNDIQSFVGEMNHFFPEMPMRYEKLSDATYAKVLPYFRERLKQDTTAWDYESHPFYKFYIHDIEDVGLFLSRYDVAYYRSSDWPFRIYIDLCTKFPTLDGFFYRWYDVDNTRETLLDSFTMRVDKTDMPNWKFAAFDIETVPMSGETNRIPNGVDPLDKIVMISVIKWDAHTKTEHLLYLNPLGGGKKLFDEYLEYSSEAKMLNDFHYLIQDCHVLTGYNINQFDIPCIFARLLWLGQYPLLARYSSQLVGKNVITTFQNKLVLDLFDYVRIFSNHDLPSLKLDDVVRVKLGEGKISIHPVGIHAWYQQQQLTRELCLSEDVEYCYDVLKPHLKHVEKFGTLRRYLEYCLKDSDLVYRLFRQENVLGFLIARANCVAFDVIQAMHYGNSRFLLDLFQTYGNLLHFYINADYLQNRTDSTKYESMRVSKKETYQGALNYIHQQETFYKNVAVMDFRSMYPTSLLSSNLCYGTCDILTTEEYTHLTDDQRRHLTAIPYRNHFRQDFLKEMEVSERFQYPPLNLKEDRFVIVINQRVNAFLPALVKHFLDTRKYHQQKWKETRNVFHYNSQLNIKLLINSLYGVMAAKETPLAYIVIAMSIVCLARYQLLGSHHFVKKLGYPLIYADTDSLMIHRWPHDHCDVVNRYLNLPYVQLNFENRWKGMLVICKKRYIYEKMNGQTVSKGFLKKANELLQFMTQKISDIVMGMRGKHVATRREQECLDGWYLWMDILLEAQYRCRDPELYVITQKTRKLDEYVSQSCRTVKMLKRYPEKEGGYIEYTYSQADVSEQNATDWIMSPQDCQYVDFGKLFTSQQKVLCTLLNMGFWQYPYNPSHPTDMVLNTMKWKRFVHAELKHYFASNKQKIMILVKKGVKYTFQLNDCFDQSKPVKIKGKKQKDTQPVKRKLNDSNTQPVKRNPKPVKRKLNSSNTQPVKRKLNNQKIIPFLLPATR